MIRGSVLRCTLLALTLSGCRSCDNDPRTEARDAEDAPASECEPRTTEKLGIPFSKLCPKDLPVPGLAFEPFWIAAHALTCAKGENATLRCPSVTPLHHPTAGDPRTPDQVPSTSAFVTDANSAQGWCYMRFAGRLPTRAERARAEVSLGLAAVIVSQSPTEPPHFELTRLAEWVSEEPCETPTVAKCRVGMYPSGERRAIPWDTIVQCGAAPFATDAGVTLLDVGESCPAPGFDWDATRGKLPCAARSVASASSVLGFALTCQRPGPPRPHPVDEPATTAAVRCVLPGMLR
jgi:hypothetical protein